MTPNTTKPRESLTLAFRQQQETHPLFAEPPVDFAALEPKARRLDECGERLPMIDNHSVAHAALRARYMPSKFLPADCCAGLLTTADCVDPPGDYTRYHGVYAPLDELGDGTGYAPCCAAVLGMFVLGGLVLWGLCEFASR